MKAIKGLDN